MTSSVPANEVLEEASRRSEYEERMSEASKYERCNLPDP